MKQILLMLLFGAMLIIGCDCSKPPVDPPPCTTCGADTQAPTVPTGLTVTGTTTNSISIGWNASTDNVGVKGYTVYRNGNQITQVMSGTAYTDAGLTASTSYTYKVSAFDAANNSSVQSSEVTGTTGANVTVPTVNTGNTVINSNTSITFNGNIISDGGASVTEHIAIVTWTTPITGTPGKDSLVVSGNGNFSYTKTDCIPGVIYSYRMAAKNSAGIGFGNTLSVNATGYHLGQSTGGGVIFWVSTDANKALVASTTDINPGVGLRWWPQGGPYVAIGATNDDLGGGDVNTNLIATHPQCLPDAAARRCYDLVQGGFSDWYLPNKIEMEQIYLNRNLPGLSGTFSVLPSPWFNSKWTSLETTAVTSAWMHDWTGTGVGAGGASSKGATGSIRPIRKLGNW